MSRRGKEIGGMKGMEGLSVGWTKYCEVWTGENPDGTSGYRCGQPGKTYTITVTTPKGDWEFEATLCDACLADEKAQNPDYIFEEKKQ